MEKNYKERFPVFSKNPNLVFLDTAASALKVDSMIKAISDCYSYKYANIHRGIYELSSKLTEQYENSRKSVCNFINAHSSNNIIFGIFNPSNLYPYFITSICEQGSSSAILIIR